MTSTLQQLVESVRVPRQSKQTSRSHYQLAVANERCGDANQTRRSDASHHHRHACQTAAVRSVLTGLATFLG